MLRLQRDCRLVLGDGGCPWSLGTAGGSQPINDKRREIIARRERGEKTKQFYRDFTTTYSDVALTAPPFPMTMNFLLQREDPLESLYLCTKLF